MKSVLRCCSPTALVRRGAPFLSTHSASLISPAAISQLWSCRGRSIHSPATLRVRLSGSPPKWTPAPQRSGALPAPAASPSPAPPAPRSPSSPLPPPARASQGLREANQVRHARRPAPYSYSIRCPAVSPVPPSGSPPKSRLAESMSVRLRMTGVVAFMRPPTEPCPSGPSAAWGCSGR